MHRRNECLLWAGLGFGIAIPVIGFLYIRKKQAANIQKMEEPSSALPTYANVGEVKHIYVYGIDGGHPIEVQKATCIGSGLQYRTNRGDHPIEDRGFVVYTEKSNHGYFECSKLLSVRLSETGTFRLETPNGEKFLQIDPSEINKKETTLIDYHTSKLQVYDCGDPAAKFLSEYLLERYSGLRLGQFVVKLMRKHLNPFENITDDPMLDQRYLLESMKPAYNSFSLISDKTIDYIKGLRGCGHVTPKHFRTQIVIGLGNGTEPWQRPFIEDHFVEVRIGSASFTNVTLRTISRFVNVDPQTGILSGNGEPFQTLQRFRPARSLNEALFDTVNTPLLGINMGIQEIGVIRVGDAVNVHFRDLSL